MESDDVLVIDLGDERWSADQLPPRRRRYGHSSRLALLLAMLAALLPFVGSTWPAPLVTAPLWDAQEPGVVVGERVYTFSNTGRLTARSVRDGAIQWQLSGETPNAYLVEVNDGLLGYVTYTERAELGERLFMRTTTRIVNPDDGRVLVTRQGAPLGRVADSAVTVFGTVIEDLDQGRCVGEGSRCFDLSGVDVRTGVVAWRLPYRPDREPIWSDTGGVIGSLGLVDAGGQFVPHDPVTGRPGRAVPIPFWPDDVADASVAKRMQLGMFSLHGATLIGARERLVALEWIVVVSSLELETGRSWSTTFGADDGGHRYPSQCGRWLCVADQRRAVVLDRDTGEEVARIDGYAMELGNPELLGLWQFEQNGPGHGRVRVFDPVAGVERGAIPGTAQSVDGRPDLLVVPAQSEARGTDVYRVGRDGQAHVVMTIDAADNCQASREYLVCSRGDRPYDDTLAIVRLRVFQLSGAAMASAY